MSICCSMDDGSGRQQWQIVQVGTTGTYTMQTILGRATTCARDLGENACGVGSSQPYLQQTAISGSTGGSQWIFTPAAAVC